MRIVLSVETYRVAFNSDHFVKLSQRIVPGVLTDPCFSLSQGKMERVLRIDQGSNCNVSLLNIIPHCHGTHTECLSHVTDNNLAITDVVTAPFYLGALLTVKPTPLRATVDTY